MNPSDPISDESVSTATETTHTATTSAASEIPPTTLPAQDHDTTNRGSGTGPLNLDQIRRMRELQARQADSPSRKHHRGPADYAKASNNPTTETKSENLAEVATNDTSSVTTLPPPESPPVGQDKRDRGRRRNDKSKNDDDQYAAAFIQSTPKVARPSIRQPLSADIEMELESALVDADLNNLMIGSPNLTVGRSIEEGSRHQGRVIKIHQDSVFVSLGGPDEGVVPLLQFTDMPQVDALIDCLVRTFNVEDGLYELALPGEATMVDDWSDIQEGLVVEATVESGNTGGLECKVGGIRGFIPMRHISEFRVEDTSEFIGKRLTCVVIEANPRRGNLIISHRAILERERQEKRAERLANLEVGQATEGIVRKIMDFGAFVDIGGLDGLLHISQLSYERVKHPGDILKEGDKIQVRVDKIDTETGKIGLSYRSLQEHPWANIEAQFPIGIVVKGTVSRIANFGAFVKLATGVEGLIHVSELAHRRISNVSSVVQEGQEVEVKILSVDRDGQRIGLSLKAVQTAPEPDPADETKVAEIDEPVRTPVVSKHRGPLKGGAGDSPAGGERFGLKW